MTAPAESPPIALRRATVAFVDLLGASGLAQQVGIERAYAIVTGCLRVLEEVARRRGAVVDKYLSDALMAVFGYPLATPEPEAAAVAAGLEMLDAVARFAVQVESPLPLELRIGINTGTVAAGDLQGPVVREFRVLGDAVNVAARLKDLGDSGRVHVGPETHAAAREHFHFEALDTLLLRGKRERVAAFRVVPTAIEAPDAPAEGSDALVDAPLVGREAVLAEVSAALAALSAGCGGAILLVGGEGLGKSRLVAAARAEAARCGVPTHRAHATDAAEIAPGTLVVCEDLHRAEDAWLAVLAPRLARAASEPVLWLLTARPEGRLEGLRVAFGDHGREIALGPLGTADAQALVRHVAADHLVSPAALERIVARAGGVPARLVLGALLAPAVETEMALERATVERSTEAERRQVTVLFADISGFTRLSEQLAPAAAYAAVTGCLQVMHDAAVKHGGSVDKHLGDCIMAVFGVPLAIEDAPRAAVNAAIEMRRRVREWNAAEQPPVPLEVHIGIDTGLGIAGDVSGALLREFALMGDAVGTASKLKDVAPAGRIWVGAETARATRADFTYERVPRDTAPEAHDLTSEREQVYRPRVGTGSTIFAELVGRDAEFGALRAAVRRAGEGTGGAAVLVGDPGLGKSRLLAELAASDEARAVHWAEGRSIPAGRTLRFHPFVDLLRSLLALGDDATPEAFARLERESAEALGADAADTLPFLGNLLGLPLPAALATRVAGAPGDVVDRLTLRAVRTLLAGLARRRPRVLVFEDVYWADRSSVELLGQLLRLGLDHPILFLWASRPGFAETAGRLIEAARATFPGEQLLELELRPLAPTDTRRLLATLFPPGSLSRAVRERIEAPAGGNPLYVEELLRSLIEQGGVEVTGAGLRATEAIESMAVPPTLQEVILSRVDRLAPVRKQVLHLAAVIGQRVAEPVLGDLVADVASCAEALSHLVDVQLLVREERAAAAHYTFKHRLIQEVAYGSILETRRAELHGQVARVIERRLPGVSGFHGMLAFQYGRAGDAERAEEHLFIAGDDAARAGAPAEALELFQESSRLYLARHPGGGDPTKLALLHRRLAEAHFFRGQLDDANRHFNEALAVLGETVPRTRLALALGLGRALATVGLGIYLRDGARGGRRPAQARDLEAIQLMFNRARAQTTADPTRFLFDSLETLRRLQGVDPASVPGAGGMYAGAIGIWSYGGISFDVGARFLGLATRYVDTTDVAENMLYRLMAFVHYFFAGDWQDGHEIPVALLDEAVRSGQLWDVSTYLGLEAFKRLAQGSFAPTAAIVDRLAEIEESYGYDLARSNRHAALAFLLTERRDLDAAAAAADTYLTEHNERLLNLFALGTKVKVHVLRGDLPAAREALGAADALLEGGRVPPIHFGFCARARLLVRLAEMEDGGGTSAGLHRLVRDATWAAARVAWLRPEIYRVAGRATWVSGRRDRGLTWLGRAIDEAERLQTTPEGGRARLDVARCLAEAGAGARFRDRDARTFLDEADRTFAGLGLAADAQQVEAVRSGTRG